MRILILEDDPFIACDLAAIVEEAGHEVACLCGSLAEARRHIDEVEFALLDVDVTDGKSFEIASALCDRHVPFSFVSGSARGELPSNLRQATFIAKPFNEAAILRLLAPVQRTLHHAQA